MSCKFRFGNEVRFRDPKFFGKETKATVVASRYFPEIVSGKGEVKNYQYRLLMEEYSESLENFLHAQLLPWFREEDLIPSEEK
jgi:hypothetical protein